MITSLRGDDGSRAALDPQPRAARLAIAIGARSGMSVNMTRFFRALFAVLAGLLVVGGLAACDEATEDIDLPEVELDPGEESPDGDAAPPSDDGDDDGDGDGGGDDDDGEALDDHGALGSLGAELLSPDLSRAQLEIDASDGVGLTGSARDALAGRLADHGGKTVRRRRHAAVTRHVVERSAPHGRPRTPSHVLDDRVGGGARPRRLG